MVGASMDCKFISKGKVLSYTITKPASVIQVASKIRCTTLIKTVILYKIHSDMGLEETKNYNERCSIKYSDI
jgi:hypothetical protein